MQVLDKAGFDRTIQKLEALFPSNYYARDAGPFASSATAITVPAGLKVSVSGDILQTTQDTVLSASGLTAGKDYYIYACKPTSGHIPVLVISNNASVPSGYTAATSRKIGGFHTLCVAAGTISGHPLTGYAAGRILPNSVWDLHHRPKSDSEGMVYHPQMKMWFDIYLASWSGSKLQSVYGAATADGASSKRFHGELFAEEFGKIGKRLLWRHEFMLAAKGSNEQTNIAGSADANTAGGHKDTAGRRMISDIGLEDCCGFLWQWTNDIWNTPASSIKNTAASATTDVATPAKFNTGDYWFNTLNMFADGKKDNLNTASDNNWHVQGTYHPDIDSRCYGWGYRTLLTRLLAGGPWGDGAFCGSRSVSSNDLSTSVNATFGGRGASEPRAVGSY